MADYDVLVVGSGPAGCAAALSAHRQGLSVLLVDAARFPRDKVCGDGIAPQALDVYAALGVSTDVLVGTGRPVTSLRLRSPGGVEVRAPMRRAAHVVPRREFDDRLRRATMAAGVAWRQQSVRRIRVDDYAVVVDDVRAGVVVGADGAESTVRRAAGFAPQPRGTTALALRGYAHEPASGGEQYLAMSARGWPAYGWTFPVGDGRVNVGYGELLDGRSPPSRDTLLSQLSTVAPSAGDLDAVRGHRLPLSTGRPAARDGRVLLVGDAAGLINPLSGEGIFYAAVSGLLAGGAALYGAGAGAAYRADLERRLGAHLRQTDLLARLCRRPAFLDAAVRAARRSPDVFATLVDLALADGRVGARTALAVARQAAPRPSRR